MELHGGMLLFLVLCFLPVAICQVRMTAALKIECRVTRDNKFNRVIAIRLHKLTADGMDELIASAGMHENGTVINSPKEDVRAASNVAPMVSENYLEVIWDNPTSEQSGDYVCEIEAINAYGIPIKDQSTQYVLSAGKHQTSPSPATTPNTPPTTTPKRLIKPDHIIWPAPTVKVVYDLTNQSTLASLASTQSEFADLLTNQSEALRGCDDIDSLPDGQYVISIAVNKTDTPFDILCDVSSGTAWTVFQKRFDGTVDFYRDYQNYTEGFGDVRGEFWLGLDKIHQLTKDGDHQLRLDMVDRIGNEYHDNYKIFWVGSEEEGFPLKIYGTMKGIARQADWRFTTFDKGPTNSCVKEHHGGWWYSGCGDSNLNGVWGVIGPTSMYWIPSKASGIDPEYNPMVTTEIKFNTV